MQPIQSVRGMNDILPTQIVYWQRLENILKEILASYGYEEVRFPVLERTELFHRSIGEITDIVEKEMYTFADRNGDSLTLRPEGTVGCTRLGIEQGLLYHQTQRWWYMGPMFRHERPQKGRYRQFHQLGVETYGLPGPDIDVELLLLSARFWQKLGLQDHVELHINSLGSLAARQSYREVLVDYFSSQLESLDEDSRRRLTSNPLRILDSKAPAMQPLIAQAPRLLDYLDAESQHDFAQVLAMLDKAKISYIIDPSLVRGLDYYNKTVFEWITTGLGAQGTICGGGRYDGLVAQLGGKATPGAGFAMGLERLVALLAQNDVVKADEATRPHVYIASADEVPNWAPLLLADELRDSCKGIRVLSHCGGGNLKAQLKRADKSGARVAVILERDSLAQARVIVKYLREQRPQLEVTKQTLAASLNEYLFSR